MNQMLVPAGFALDAPRAATPPPGFAIDAHAPSVVPPPGFRLDAERREIASEPRPWSHADDARFPGTDAGTIGVGDGFMPLPPLAPLRESPAPVRPPAPLEPYDPHGLSSPHDSSIGAGIKDRALGLGSGLSRFVDVGGTSLERNLGSIGGMLSAESAAKLPQDLRHELVSLGPLGYLAGPGELAAHPRSRAGAESIRCR